MKDPTPGQARDKIISDFRSLATHAQDLLQATASYSGDGVTAARERLLEASARRAASSRKRRLRPSTRRAAR